MRRALIAALIATTLLGAARGLPENSASTRPLHLQPVAAKTATREGPCDAIRWREGQHEVKLLIECVWDRFHPGYGGAAKALDVARCESGLNPRAYYNNNAGLWQFNLRYWPERYMHLIANHDRRSTWGLPDTAYNARTASVVAALTVRRGGWSIWSCG